MTVPVPVLDDLTWDAMMQAVRLQIPAESGGRWTLHAPVDPGITLLELFAYLLEQRLYRLDQVPDELVVAVLRLLGVAPPQPATAAATVLQLVSAAAEAVVSVPAGTVFTRDPAQSLTFTLGQDVAVLPLLADPPQLLAGGRDLSADLAAGRGVPLLSAGGQPDQFQIALRPDPAGALPPAGTALSLLFVLDADVACPPAWSPSSVDGVPPPAALAFTWYQPAADGSVASTLGTPSTVEDGTAGLRRSGVIRLTLPPQWCTGGGADTPPQRYGLLVATQAATYSAPPVLLALVPNTGEARQRQTRTVTDADPAIADQVRGWLRLPGQRLVLPDAAGLLISSTVDIWRNGQRSRWQAVPDFTFGGPADQIFVLDRTDGAVRFGDGLTGAIPVPDPLPDPGSGAEPVISVEYVRGGG
ncbi:MAG: hypothetical protein J2P15_23295, partial [Micromonosporaceae bacterium]|nr:hypothetical protein [Micromonosporaceae bacterium]